MYFRGGMMMPGNPWSWGHFMDFGLFIGLALIASMVLVALLVLAWGRGKVGTWEREEWRLWRLRGGVAHVSRPPGGGGGAWELRRAWGVEQGACYSALAGACGGVGCSGERVWSRNGQPGWRWIARGDPMYRACRVGIPCAGCRPGVDVRNAGCRRGLCVAMAWRGRQGLSGRWR